MSYNDMKDYLLSLPQDVSIEDKRYALNFCKKIEYLNSLRDIAAKETSSMINFGYGDVNSKICFIFDNINSFKKIKENIQKVLDVFKMNYWQSWITFIDKTDIEYNNKLELLSNELYAIKPDLIYYFSINDERYNSLLNIIDNFNKINNVQVCKKIFYININDIVNINNDNIKSGELWNKMRYIVNYKSI